MVILLAGSSTLGRSAVASRLVKQDRLWRHLPLEELATLQPLKNVQLYEQEDVMLRIACQCAIELHEQGYHLIISCDYLPSAVAIARDELGDLVIPVHMGNIDEIEESTFPHLLDSKQSTVGDVCDYLYTLIPTA